MSSDHAVLEILSRHQNFGLNMRETEVSVRAMYPSVSREASRAALTLLFAKGWVGRPDRKRFPAASKTHYVPTAQGLEVLEELRKKFSTNKTTS